MPRKSKSRKKKGGKGFFDFLKAGESKSYHKKRCNQYQNEITKLEKRIDELKSKQEEHKCLGGGMMTNNPMEQSEPEPEPEPQLDSELEPDNRTEPQLVDSLDGEIDSSDDEDEKEMKPLYPNNDAAVEDVLNEVKSPEDRKDDSIAKTVTDIKGGRRRRRKSRRKSKRKSRKRRKSRKKKKSRKRRRRKSRR